MCEPQLFKHAAPGFTCVTHPAGHGLRLQPTDAPRPLRQHPDQPCGQQGHDNRLCGKQLRPNLHIKDMADVYELMIEAPDEKIAGQIFNAGYQNLSIARSRKPSVTSVRKRFLTRDAIEIVTTESNDPRSYHINSDKIRRILGYSPKALGRGCRARSLRRVRRRASSPTSFDDSRYFNVRTMKQLNAA